MAHRGITVADVPNLFFLLGPNTGLGHNSVVFMIESQIRYVAAAIAAADKAGAQALAPTRAAQDRFNDELQDDLSDHGVEHRRLPQLVSRRTRRQPLAVVGLGLGVLAGDPEFQAVGVQVLRSRRSAERDTPDTTCCGAERCRTPGVVSWGAGSGQTNVRGEMGFL